MLKLSRTAIRELSKMYRAVLIGVLTASTLTVNYAAADTNVIVGGTYDASAGTLKSGTSTNLDTLYDTYGAATNAVNALDSTKSKTAGNDGLALQITQTDGKITSISGSIAANTYDAYGAATNAVNALDSTKSKTAGNDGLALQITQTDGKITSISGSIAANTYDAYGAAGEVETKLTSGGASGYDISAKSVTSAGNISTTSGTVSGNTLTAGSGGISSTGTISSNGEINAGTKVHVGGTTDSNSRIILNGTADAGNIKLNNSSNNTTITLTSESGNISATSTNLTGNLTAGSANINGDTSITGNETVTGSITAGTGSNKVTLNSGSVTAAGTVSGNKVTAGSGGISSTGGANITGTTAITGNESVSGQIFVGGTELSNSRIVLDSTTDAGNVTLKNSSHETTITLGSGSGNITASGQVSGNTVNATNGLTVNAGGATITSGGLTVSAGGANITGGATISTGGLTVSAGGANITGDTHIEGDESVSGKLTAGTLKTAGIDTTVSDKVKLGGTGYTTEITGSETVTGLITAQSGIKVSGGSLAIGSNNVSAIDNGSSAQSSGGSTTMATVATVLKSAENAAYNGTKTNVGANTTTIKGAIQDLDTKIGTVATSTNGVANSNTVGANIDALNNKMGNVAELGTYTGAKGNLTNGTTTSPTSVVQALENIDQSMGKIHGLVNANGSVAPTKQGASTVGNHSNLAKTATPQNTTVEDHLISLDNAIGNRTLKSENATINTAMSGTSLSAGLVAAGNAIGSTEYSSTHYVKQGMNLTEAVSALDKNMDKLDEKVSKMDKQMKSGFASMAAIAGLKPNARACSDTQIAVGGGYYRGTAGFALGGFHYVNDNLMLNIGAGYAGNQSATVSGGLTFGW